MTATVTDMTPEQALMAEALRIIEKVSQEMDGSGWHVLDAWKAELDRAARLLRASRPEVTP